MDQTGTLKPGSESWKRTLAVLLAAVMVAMVAAPMVNAQPAGEPTPDSTIPDDAPEPTSGPEPTVMPDTSGVFGIASQPQGPTGSPSIFQIPGAEPEPEQTVFVPEKVFPEGFVDPRALPEAGTVTPEVPESSTPEAPEPEQAPEPEPDQSPTPEQKPEQVPEISEPDVEDIPRQISESLPRNKDTVLLMQEPVVSGMDTTGTTGSIEPVIPTTLPPYHPLAPPYDVLLLTPDQSGGDISFIQGILGGYGDLTVTTWDTSWGNPALIDILPFDVVIIGNDYLWESEGLDKAIIGNVIADYIDAGGKVIESLYIQSFDQWGFGGRYMTDGYSPFTWASLDYWNPDSLSIVDPTHPVMAGVATLNDGWGHQNPGLAAGASLLATWSGTGYNAIACNNDVVAFNMMWYFGASLTGDAGTLIHNAIVWLAEDAGPIALSPNFQMDSCSFVGEEVDYPLTLSNNLPTAETFDLHASNNAWPTEFIILTSSVFTEDFNGAWPPAGWTILDNDGEGPWYQSNVDIQGMPSPDGTLAATVEYGTTNNDDWLISPTMDCSGASNVHLSYDYNWESDWDFSWSEGYVLGSTDGGATWTQSIYTFQNNSAWTTGTHTWDISAWADGQANVAIAFHYVSVMDDWLWLIDNVNVFEPEYVATSIGPVPSGGSADFIARVTVPGGAGPGDFDIADITATISGSAPPTFDDFEAGPGGWVPTATWDPVGDWEWTNTYNGASYVGGFEAPPNAYSGTGLWGTVMYDDYTNAGGFNYLTQTFDFTGWTNSQISWWSWENTFGAFDYCQLTVNGAVVWGPSWDEPATQWRERVVDLSAYDGNPSVTIQFEMYATAVVERAGWYIDDVIVSADVISSNVAQIETVWPLAFPWHDDMESGTVGWAADGMWHLVEDGVSPYPNSYSPTHSWWYGQDATGNYDNGAQNWGRLETPAIDLTGETSAWFSFAEWFETEGSSPSYDIRVVQINTGSGWTDIQILPEDYWYEWLFRTIDLTPYCGNVVRLGLWFDTVDDIANDFFGWYVDNFYVGPYAVDANPDYQANWGYWTEDVDHTITVNNIGSLADTYDITPIWNVWPVSFWDASGAVPIASTGNIPAGGSETIIARVTVPDGIMDGSADWALILFESQNNPGYTGDQVVVETTAYNPYGVAVGPPYQFNSAYWTEGADHYLTIENTGVWPDTYDLTYTSPLGWPIEFYAASGGGAPVTLLDEDFEGGVMPPAGWSVVDGAASTRHWQLVDTISHNPAWIHGGTYAGWVNWEALDQDEWLISPLLDLSGAASSQAEFWVYANNNWVGFAELQFLVIYGGGAFTDTLWQQSGETWPFPSVHHQVQVDLSAYVGQSVNLAWRYVGNNGDSIALDDILVTGVLAGEPIGGPITSINIPAGGTANVLARVTVPYGVMEGTTDLADITVTSQGDPIWTSDTVQVETEALNPFGVDVTPIYQFNSQYWTLRADHYIIIENTGVWPDRYNLAAVFDPSWPVTFWNAAGTTQITHTGWVPAGSTVTVLARVTVPYGVMEGTTDLADITVTSQGDPIWTSDTVQVETEALNPYDVTLTPGAQSATGYVSDHWDFTVTVTNTGLLFSDRYDLSVTGNAWPTSFWTTYGTPLSITPLLAPGASYDFIVRVDIPALAPPGDWDEATIRATSYYDPTSDTWHTATVQTFCASPYGVDLYPNWQEDWGSTGHYVDYPLTVENTGVWTETYGLTYTSVNGWPVTFHGPGIPTLTPIYLLTQDFEGPFPPSGWTVLDHEGTGLVWQRNDYWGYDNYAGSGFCADANSDAAGSEWMTTSLRTPGFSLDGDYENAVLKYNMVFNSWSGWEWGEVRVTTDGWSTWDMLAYYDTDINPWGPGVAVALDLSPYIGSPNVMIEFLYANAYYDYFWQIDDVQVIANADDIASIGPLLPGETADFIARVHIPAGLPPGSWENTWVRATCRHYYYVWDEVQMDTYGEPEYWFGAGPDTQTNFGMAGDWVEHVVTITNEGTEPDVYLPMFYNIYGPDTDADWWTKFHFLDLRPQGIYNGIDDGSETWWWGPVEPGETRQYAVKVYVPTNQIGAFDQAAISITSSNDPTQVHWVEIWTRNSLPQPFYDDFEEAGDWGQYGLYWDYFNGLGYVNGAWKRSDANLVGVNSWTSHSGWYSMYTSGGECTATSAMINMDIPYGIASCVIQRGSDAFSEDPDGGEDLVVEYSDGAGQWMQWHELATFPGNGVPGEIFTPLWILPDNALNKKFQIRFRQTGGSGWDYDYWHIDDVYVGEPQSNFQLTGGTHLIGNAGDLVQAEMTIINNALHADTFNIEVGSSTWPTRVWTPMFGDDFNDLNWNGWTRVDEGTISAPSNWYVDNNGVLRQTSNIYLHDGQNWPGTYLWNGDTSWTDYILRTDMMSSDNDGIGLMARYTDANNYYRFYWGADGGWDWDFVNPGHQYRVLDKCVNGVRTVLVSDNVPYTQNQWYDVEMKLIGDHIQVYIDGNQIFDVIDDSLDHGAVALYSWGNTGIYFDDVIVYGEGQTLGPIGPDMSESFIVTMEVPGDAALGEMGTASIVAHPIADPWHTDTETLQVGVPRVHNLDQDTWYWDIQAAVDEANPWDTILAYPGTYHEHVLVEKPLWIQGVDRDTTIVDGQELGSPFTVRSDYVAISGFTIMNSGFGPDDFVPDRAGIKLDGTVECEIFDNLITNNHMGVLSMFGTFNIIAENEFRDNYIGQYSMNGIEDDFSADSGLWIYENHATLEPGYMQLTPSANSQWGRALFIDEVDITSRFTAEFEYQIGNLGGGGADGLVFMFYKDTDYAPIGGGSLAFGTTTGYGIELDHWAGGYDPSAEHIALIKDDVSTHLASSNQNIDNNVWNRVRVVVDTNTITVYHIDMVTPIFTWTGEIDRTFGGMGFCAATGGAMAHHRVRDFSITPIEQSMIPISDLFVENVVEDNYIGYITMFGHNNLVAINRFANNGYGCFLGLESAIGFNYPSRGNNIFWNDFIPGLDTDELAIDFTPNLAPGLNYWDGVSFLGLEEGNYWGDYQAKYPGAAESLVLPGIWDTPYEIEPFLSPTQDNFPLMGEMFPLMSPSPTPYAAGGDGLAWFYSVVDSLSALERWSPAQEAEADPEVAPAESGGGAISLTGTPEPATPAQVPPAKNPVAQEPDEGLSDEPVTADTVQTETAAPAQSEPAPDSISPAAAPAPHLPMMAFAALAAIALLACCAAWLYRRKRR